MSNTGESEVATLGGGCFWCLDAVYRQLRGVQKVVSGYAGGTTPNPSYREVCGGRTGHAEVVQITFDPAELTYRELLNVFFTIHDPTTLNRQGGDIGPQYRSIILTHSDEQARVAREAMAEITAEGIWDDPIVTEIEPLTTFYPAEQYHQDYFANNGEQPYCQVVIAPKVAKFRRKFLEKMRV
jgi:peptide-methionine (S)-S-oxide reductase